jgi:hypothetical protein
MARGIEACGNGSQFFGAAGGSACDGAAGKPGGGNILVQQMLGGPEGLPEGTGGPADRRPHLASVCRRARNDTVRSSLSLSPTSSPSPTNSCMRPQYARFPTVMFEHKSSPVLNALQEDGSSGSRTPKKADSEKKPRSRSFCRRMLGLQRRESRGSHRHTLFVAGIDGTRCEPLLVRNSDQGGVRLMSAWCRRQLVDIVIPHNAVTTLLLYVLFDVACNHEIHQTKGAKPTISCHVRIAATGRR